MNFYTNVCRVGNNILYRGYEDGKKVSKKISFKPKLFIETPKATGKYKSLYGNLVEPVEFDSLREASDFIKRYQDVTNFTIYGMTNFVTQYLAEKYPYEIKFDRDKINVTSIDIEVQSDQGFPNPDEAKHEVTAIGL